MLEAWIVVRKEHHIDDKYWICMVREDAIEIAKEVSAYWVKEYEPEPVDIYTELLVDQIFCTDVDEAFTVDVCPQVIRGGLALRPRISRRCSCYQRQRAIVIIMIYL